MPFWSKYTDPPTSMICGINFFKMLMSVEKNLSMQYSKIATVCEISTPYLLYISSFVPQFIARNSKHYVRRVCLCTTTTRTTVSDSMGILDASRAPHSGP